MRLWASPQLLSSTRIRQRKRGTAPLPLPARRRSLSMSLALLSPALCSSLERWRTNYSPQLLTGNSLQEWGGEKTQSGVALTCGAARRLRAPVGRRGGGWKKFVEGTSSFVLWSPPLSTRVIDGWGSFLAAPSSFRSPKSPALSKSNNYSHNIRPRTGWKADIDWFQMFLINQKTHQNQNKKTFSGMFLLTLTLRHI